MGVDQAGRDDALRVDDRRTDRAGHRIAAGVRGDARDQVAFDEHLAVDHDLGGHDRAVQQDPIGGADRDRRIRPGVRVRRGRRVELAVERSAERRARRATAPDVRYCDAANNERRPDKVSERRPAEGGAHDRTVQEVGRTWWQIAPPLPQDRRKTTFPAPCAPCLPSRSSRPPPRRRLPTIRRSHSNGYKLPNGLEVILAPDSSVPLVAVNVWYHVGSGYEVRGQERVRAPVRAHDVPGLEERRRGSALPDPQASSAPSRSTARPTPIARTTTRSCRRTSSRPRCGSRAIA